MTNELRSFEHRVATRETAFNAAWWPEELGSASTADQANGVLYAVFPDAKKLATTLNGSIQL